MLLDAQTPLRGLVRPGNSGGPVVDSSGKVLGTVFAAITGAGGGGFAVPDDKVSAQLANAKSRTAPVSAGPCAPSSARRMSTARPSTCCTDRS